MGAFGDLEPGASAVDWSLVGGLFDPSDDVAVQAIAAVARRGLSSADATAVARERLRQIARSGATALGVRPSLRPCNGLISSSQMSLRPHLVTGRGRSERSER